MALLTDGHPTTITFSDTPDITLKICEKTVTPGGIEGGGANDTTCMRNLVWRTRQPKKLKTLTEGTFTASYDPSVFIDLVAAININQELTVNFPDGSKYKFFGWIDNFAPNEITEGEQPTAEVTFMPSNQDNTGAEVDPTYIAPP